MNLTSLASFWHVLHPAFKFGPGMTAKGRSACMTVDVFPTLNVQHARPSHVPGFTGCGHEVYARTLMTSHRICILHAMILSA
jgi:hypothetical protein